MALDKERIRDLAVRAGIKPGPLGVCFLDAMNEIDLLREQIAACETSLSIFDEGNSSEYWERYPGNSKHQ